MADGLSGLPGLVRARRVQFSMRLDEATKHDFSAASQRAGLDPSAAARCLLELCVQRLEVEPDLLAVLHSFRTPSPSMENGE